MSSGSASLASPRDQTRNPCASRSAQAMATMRCRCKGRKSPPVAARRCWRAQASTSASPSEAGSAWTRRSPAMSGIVSMSKTRVGVIAPRAVAVLAWPSQFLATRRRERRAPAGRPSSRKNASRQVSVAAIADDEDDGGVFDLARDTQRHGACAAGGDAGEDALLGREPPRHVFGLGLRHVLEPIDAPRIIDLRQVGFGPLAYAGDLRTLFGLATDDGDRRVLFFQEPACAHDRSGGPHARHEMRDAALSVAPDLRAGSLVVRERIVGIGELIEDDALAFSAHFL